MSAEQIMSKSAEKIMSNKDGGLSERQVADLPPGVHVEGSDYSEWNKQTSEILSPDITYIENTKFSALLEQNKSTGDSPITDVSVGKTAADENLHGGLTEKGRETVREETGWPDEIINRLGSVEEYEKYKEFGLHAAEVDGKWSLVRDDIDMNQKDDDGFTNQERMERGLSPLTKDGETVELHHIGQKPDSPLAEMTTQEHRGAGNDLVFHDKSKESEIDRSEFAKERRDYWIARQAQA